MIKVYIFGQLHFEGGSVGRLALRSSLNLHKFPFSPRILILLSFGVCTTLNVYDSASSISAPENVDNKQSSPKETIKPREKAELFD